MPGKPAPQKLYIKTFGCQMNEYDSDKMADVLAAPTAWNRPTDRSRGRRHPVQYLLGAREGAGESVFPTSAAGKQLKQANPRLHDRRRRLRRQPGRRRRSSSARPTWTWCSARRRCTACRRCWSAPRAQARRRWTSPFPRSRSSTICRSRAPKAPRPSCRSWKAASKYCTFLRRAVYARRGSQPSARRRDGGSAALAAQGVREVTLLGQNVNAYRGATATAASADFAVLLDAIAQGAGHRAHPLHHLAPAGIHPAPDRRLREACRKLVNHLHLPVQSGSDRMLAAMKRGYTALEYKHDHPQAARGAARTSASPRDFIVGFPGETEADFEQTMKLIDEVGFDQSSSASSSARVPARRRRIWPTTRRMR